MLMAGFPISVVSQAFGCTRQTIHKLMTHVHTGRVDRGGGVKGAVGGDRGSGGRGIGDNINYLLKMITENKVFHFPLRNWMFLSASDVCQIPFLTLFPLVWQFLFV